MRQGSARIAMMSKGGAVAFCSQWRVLCFCMVSLCASEERLRVGTLVEAAAMRRGVGGTRTAESAADLRDGLLSALPTADPAETSSSASQVAGLESAGASSTSAETGPGATAGVPAETTQASKQALGTLPHELAVAIHIEVVEYYHTLRAPEKMFLEPALLHPGLAAAKWCSAFLLSKVGDFKFVFPRRKDNLLRRNPQFDVIDDEVAEVTYEDFAEAVAARQRQNEIRSRLPRRHRDSESRCVLGRRDLEKAWRLMCDGVRAEPWLEKNGRRLVQKQKRLLDSVAFSDVAGSSDAGDASAAIEPGPTMHLLCPIGRLLSTADFLKNPMQHDARNFVTIDPREVKPTNPVNIFLQFMSGDDHATTFPKVDGNYFITEDALRGFFQEARTDDALRRSLKEVIKDDFLRGYLAWGGALQYLNELRRWAEAYSNLRSLLVYERWKEWELTQSAKKGWLLTLPRRIMFSGLGRRFFLTWRYLRSVLRHCFRHCRHVDPASPRHFLAA